MRLSHRAVSAARHSLPVLLCVRVCARVFVQRREPRRSDGGGAVPRGLGHGAGQQLRRHRGALRRTGQRLPGDQPAAPDPEEAGAGRGTGPEESPRVCPVLQ